MVNGGDIITIDGTVPVSGPEPRLRPIVRKTTPNWTHDTVAYRRRPCLGWPTAPQSDARNSSLPILASDCGEEHETEVGFGRTSTHRRHPARFMGRDRSRANARR